ncbi:DUF4286 family protein [Deminuibacter soli]|uniref:DUF4286 family protein n=1 Tax=Deminuibacter soli TaxID=2291815 RepID=A0A3E1NRM5_9BACT|nr:DUF4286 family protein [Deminuibacter soli]RFM30567.1 DUF4286 family protein [Deminuibacter soli]
MFIYNITTKVDTAIHDAWLQWMLDVHIPEVLGTGCFEKHQLVRIREIDDSDGPTYAIQYYAAGKALYNRYIQQYAPALQLEVRKTWGDSIVSFNSLMEVVN